MANNVDTERPLLFLICPLCGDKIEGRLTKKQKPCFLCEDCGIQFFFRLSRGIERLKKASRGNKLLLKDYVLCVKCKVAVRRLKKKISEPILRKNGIYCPSCDAFLLEADQI